MLYQLTENTNEETCPNCGMPLTDPVECDYCDWKAHGDNDA